MKKAISIALAVVVVAALATDAIAFGPCYGMGKGYDMMSHNLTPEQAQKFAQFQKDVLPLRQKMLQLKTELTGLRTQTTPDWDAIAAKQKEMVDVRTEIQKKATETGITGFGPCSCKGGKGKGMMGMGKMGM